MNEAVELIAPTGGNTFWDVFHPEGILPSLLLVAATVAVVGLLRRGMALLAERFEGRRLSIMQLGTLAIFSLYGAATLLVFVLLFDLSSQTLFALSGVLAVSVGFALKGRGGLFLCEHRHFVCTPLSGG